MFCFFLPFSPPLRVCCAACEMRVFYNGTVRSSTLYFSSAVFFHRCLDIFLCDFFRAIFCGGFFQNNFFLLRGVLECLTFFSTSIRIR